MEVGGGPGPQLTMPPEGATGTRNPAQVVDRLDRMRRKAQWQLGQKLIRPINEWFGPKTPVQRTKSEIEDSRSGLVILTEEERKQREKELE